jgi:hypothetical protein
VDPDADRAVVEALGRDRVVEVARGRRVDREGGEVAQVLAGAFLSVRRPLGRLAGGALDGGVEAAAQPAVEHQRLEHVARVVGPPEPARDLAVPAP